MKVIKQENCLFLLLAWSKFSSKKSLPKENAVPSIHLQDKELVYLNNAEHYKGLATLRNRSPLVHLSIDHNWIWPGGCVLNKPTRWISLVKHLIYQRPQRPQFSNLFLFIVRLWWFWTLAPFLNCIVSVYCKYCNCIDLWNLAACPCTVLGWAQWWVDDFGFFGSVPFFSAAGNDRVGTAVHHPGVKAVGHGEGLQMAL